MNVKLHYPTKLENLCLLRQKVAAVHAEAVLQYINKLPCSKEQKIEILNILKEKAYRNIKVDLR